MRQKCIWVGRTQIRLLIDVANKALTLDIRRGKRRPHARSGRRWRSLSEYLKILEHSEPEPLGLTELSAVTAKLQQSGMHHLGQFLARPSRDCRREKQAYTRAVDSPWLS